MNTSRETCRRRFLLGGAQALLATGAWIANPQAGLMNPTMQRVAGQSVEDPSQRQSVSIRDAGGKPVGVTAMDVDPAGRFIAVAGDDNRIQILNPRTFRAVESLGGHRDRIRSLAIDFEGKSMASVGNDGRLIVWSTQQSFEKIQSLNNTPALARVQFSPDAKRLAAVGFTTTIFMIGREGDRSKKINCEHTDLRAIAFREDGEKFVVAGQGGIVHGFDEDGTEVFAKQLHRGPINEMRFLPASNELISIGDDGRVIRFDTEAKKAVGEVDISHGKLFAIAVLSSNLVAVAGSDDEIRIIDWSAEKVSKTLKGHHGSIVSMAEMDGDLISAGYDATLRRWSIDSVEPQRVANKEAIER
jgi:WD40 repeat protein